MHLAIRKLPLAITALMAIAGLIAFTSCGRKDREVRIGYLPLIASLPHFIALDQGLYQAHGATVSSQEIASSNDLINGLIAGQFDVLPAVAIIPVIHLEIESPGRVRLFSHSRMTADKAFDSIVAAEGSKINSLEDLSGKKIGVFPGTSARNLLKYFLSKKGIDVSGIQFIELAPQTQLASLKAGAIDALFSYEPITTVARESGFKTIFGSVYAALQNKSPFGASVVSRRFEKEQPDAAKRAIAAIDEAVTFMNQKPNEAKLLLPKYLNLAPNIARDVNVVDVTLENEVDLESLQRFIDLLYDAGEISERIDARRLVD